MDSTHNFEIIHYLVFIKKEQIIFVQNYSLQMPIYTYSQTYPQFPQKKKILQCGYIKYET